MEEKRYTSNFLKHKYNEAREAEVIEDELRDALDKIYGEIEEYYGITIDEEDYGRLIFNEKVIKKLADNISFIVREAYSDAYRDYKYDHRKNKGNE